MGGLNGPPTVSALPQISGVVHGGQQPVTGATIQLYAANMTADLGASAPLLTSTVTTDSNGNFTITGDYTCPVTNPPVYLVATGGNPGLPGSVNNTDIVLMASLGLCGNLSSSTYVVINEFSTLGMTYLLAPFMQDSTHIGASATNPGGMVSLFTSAASFSSDPYGLTSNSTLAGLEFNTFSDILAACVNTSGGASGSSTPCGQLLSLTGAADTATAALKITQTPSSNASALYALISGTPPFQPYYSGVPSDFSTTTTGFLIPQNERTAALDSNGHIWLYSGGFTYNTVTNTSTDVQGVITVYDGNFSQLFTVSPGTGGLYYPDSLAADASGNVYAVNANNTISKFNSAGAAVSPSGGWSTGIATVFTGTLTGTGTPTGGAYVTGSAQAGPIKIDSAGNIWGKSPTGNCYFEMNSSGTVITPTSGTACATLGGSITGKAAAPDGTGNVWAEGFSGIVKINSAGNVAVTAPTSTGCFSPSAGEYTSTNGLLYDYVHSQVWGFSDTGAGAIGDSGSAVFCDASSSTIPAIAPPGFSLLTTGNPVTLNGLQINSAALDGAGNLWFTTNGSFASGTAASTTTFNGTVNHSAWLGEISPSGAILSPFNPGAGIYGYQPAGLGMNVSANVTGESAIAATTDDPSISIDGIDNAGNIFATDTYTRKVIKISGLATANTLNY